MSGDQRRQVLKAVESLQDERDELLELLGHVVAAESGADDDGRFTVPGAVMAEIRRRVGATKNAPTRAGAAGNGPPSA